VWLRVYAPMTSIGKIVLGGQVSVTTQAAEGKTYVGRVASIKDEPEFTPKNVQTAEERVKLVYAVRIEIDNKSHELKPGLPADAVFDGAAK
jgi:HlyD family secretion protein